MRGRLLTLWLALIVLALVFANQVWWVITINTGEPATVVQGTGFDSSKPLSPVLLFGLAAWLLVIFSRGWLAVTIAWVSTVATVLLLVLTVINFLRQNIGGIAGTVSTHTGIAIDPILGSNDAALLSGQLQFWAWLTLAVLVLLALVQAVFALSYRRWAKSDKPKSDRTKTKQSATDAADPIALWDSQR